MIFLVSSTILAGFGSYLVPFDRRARHGVPRLNALSYWLYFLGGVVLMLSFLATDEGSRQLDDAQQLDAPRADTLLDIGHTSSPDVVRRAVDFHDDP